MVARDNTKHEGRCGGKGYNMRDGMVARDITKHEEWYGGKGYNKT